jgi:2-amino-4-hydroxy-6-hydroxymethyldihydropteridine diphosphokinase
MTRFACIGLGSNLNQPDAQIETALGELDAIPGARLSAWSSLYRTAPLDVPSPQPDYVNAVALVRTELSPLALLAALQAIEARRGTRAAYRNAPRALDLDLLLMDRCELASATLTLPHPRMHERAFVLIPLIEIAPEATIPGHGSARALLQALAHDPRQRVLRLRAAHPHRMRLAHSA